MESNGNRHQYNHKSGQGDKPLPRSESENLLGGQQGFSLSSEVMGLALQITNISTDIYEIIADVAKCLPGSSYDREMTEHPDKQRQTAALLTIVDTIKTTEIQLRRVDSLTVTERPAILGEFLEDCWTALTTFREVSVHLAEAIGVVGWENPRLTASETLAQILTQLHSCWETVSGLPGSGLAASTLCMAHSALHLQRQAGRLAEQANGHS